ncbi:hypothetical protein EVG20_g1915 [Dentipellis fragilis]|uniref:GST N-terminal domain-containing protein n=1 Tax=Dentipellis fragilis TaxID=205917 RepID=A0A4Y9ZBA4_9AGAM|nr:hypothetical protein EVG20_g1915 [Dentipellis fragilis]
MTQTLTFYDIPGNASPTKAWTPNPWKGRLALTMKGLPHRTVWVEYPDIADVCKKLGAQPTGTRGGQPLYTLPVLEDPNTGAITSESFSIAEYLDATYPDTLQLIPKGTKALQIMFRDVFEEKVFRMMLETQALGIVALLSPESSVYWREKVGAAFGKKLEDLLPDDHAKEERWNQALQGLSILDKWANQNESGPFIMGESPSFADVVLAAHLIWLETLAGGDSKEWKSVMEADGGRWARLNDEFRKWYWVDEESAKPV